MKKNNLLPIIIVALLTTVGGFFAGVKYQQSKQPSRANFRMMGEAGENLPRNNLGSDNQMIRGEIINQDSESVTVKLTDDSSKIILISDETKINKASEGSTDDLKTGEQIMIFGKQNSDGSVSADQIQLNPEFGRGLPPSD